MNAQKKTSNNLLSMEALTWLSAVDYSNRDKYTHDQRMALIDAAAKMYPPTREELLMEQLDKLLNW